MYDAVQHTSVHILLVNFLYYTYNVIVVLLGLTTKINFSQLDISLRNINLYVSMYAFTQEREVAL